MSHLQQSLPQNGRVHLLGRDIRSRSQISGFPIADRSPSGASLERYNRSRYLWQILDPPECTKIAHRRSLAIFTADEVVAGNSAARTSFTHFLRRRNRGSLAIVFAEEIAQLAASKIARCFGER